MYTCHWKSGGEGIFAGIQKTLAQVKRLETFTKTLVMYHSIAKTNQKIKSATTGKKQRIFRKTFLVTILETTGFQVQVMNNEKNKKHINK